MHRRKKTLLILVGCGFVVATATCVFLPEDQPFCRGQSLSQWIAVYRIGPDGLAFRRASATDGKVTGRLSAETMEADASLRQIGTNAVPCLLKWIQYQPAAWRQRLWAGVNDVLTDPDESDGTVADWLIESESEARAYDSVLAFRILGETASPAIPELKRLVIQTTNLDVASRAFNALVGVEKDVSPFLSALLANTNTPASLRQEAAHWFGYTACRATNATAYVPILVACLSDQNSIVAYEAAKSLGRIALEPEVCVPALADCLTNSLVRYPAIRALAQFGSSARQALPTFQRALNDHDPLVRAAAAKAIRSIAPDVWSEERHR